LSGLNVSGRYVVVSLVANGAYLFADEIEVLEGTADSATPLEGPFVTRDTWGEDVAAIRKAVRTDSHCRAEIRRILQTISADPVANGLAESAAALGGNLNRANLSGAEREGLLDSARVLNARLAALVHPGNPLLVWPGEMWKDFTSEEFPLRGPVGLQTIPVTLGADEYESVGFMVFNTRAEASAVRVSISDLVGKDAVLPAKNITLRWAATVESSDGVVRPDALPRLDEGAFDLPSGQNRLLWLTLKTDNQPAGEYRGTVTLSTEDRSFPMELKVRVVGVALPRPIPLATYNWAYFGLGPFRADLDAGIRDLRAHYIDTAVLHPAELPKFVFDAQGRLTSSDFTAFDEAVRRYLAAGIRKFFFFQFFGDIGSGVSRPVGTGSEIPKTVSVGSPEWKNAMRQFVAAYVERCAALGLGYHDFAFYPVDEPNDKMIEKNGVGVWSVIQEMDPKVRVFVDPGASVKNLTRLAPFMDVWCPHLPRDRDLPATELAFYQSEQKAGKSFFTYNCQGSDKTFAPLGHYRQMLWRCWNLGITGAGFWNYSDTGYLAGEMSAWTDFDGSRPDFSIVYDAATAPPGVSRREAQIPSRRWEAWRDGVEDYAFLWELRRRMENARAEGRDAQAVAKAEAVLKTATEQVTAQPDEAAVYRFVHAAILEAIGEFPR